MECSAVQGPRRNTKPVPSHSVNGENAVLFQMQSRLSRPANGPRPVGRLVWTVREIQDHQCAIQPQQASSIRNVAFCHAGLEQVGKGVHRQRQIETGRGQCPQIVPVRHLELHGTKVAVAMAGLSDHPGRHVEPEHGAGARG